MNIDERVGNRYEIGNLIKSILNRLVKLESGGNNESSQTVSNGSWKREVILFDNNPNLLNVVLEPQTEYVLQDLLDVGKTLNVNIVSNSSVNSKMLEYRVVVTTGNTIGTLVVHFNGINYGMLWKGGNTPVLEQNTIYRFRIVQYPTHLFLEIE